MVTIEMGGMIATVDNRQWTADNESLATLLNGDAELWRPADYEPWPDMALAQQATQQYGGRIVSQRQPGQVAGRVY